MSILLVSLDNTVINAALPSVQRDLGASLPQLQWVVDAYTVVLATLFILSGSIADRVGRKRIFQTGLTLFCLGSLLCSTAPSPGWLIAFRMLQAIGGSMLNPVAMSIIRNVFADPRERAQAIGIWGSVVGVAVALGPILGGALTTWIGWRSIFWINVPVCVAAIALVRRLVPESRAARVRRVDPVGQFLAMVGLASLTYAIIEGGVAGWDAARIQVAAAIAALAAVVFVVYELRRADPLVDIRFFRNGQLAGATVAAVAAFIAFGAFLFVTNLYLQGDRGLSPLESGVYMLPMAAVAVVMAVLSGRIVGRRGPRLALVLAGAGLAGGSLMLTQATPDTPTLSLLSAYFVFGLGFGLVNPPITNAAVSGMPPDQAGVAAAIASTSRLLGMSLGVAVIGAIVVSETQTSGVSVAVASQSGWWICAACGLAVAAIGVISTSRWALRTGDSRETIPSAVP